ncbi:cytochrome b [Litorimonas sp. RW-G-Af-16]|uniref:cytochrome b n=1 Tax=Litorimonas sp. RW-G-Af-16 TaxID=3241168 RepID=UPI00390C6291
MTRASTQTVRYTRVAITLHWLIALMIIGLLAFGVLMTNEAIPNRFALYQWHKSFGITVLFLSFVRLFWRLGHKPPPLPDGTKGWEIAASKLTHIGFYVLMIGMPLIGWAMVSASKLPIPTVLFYTIPWPNMPGIPRDEGLEDLLKLFHEIGGKLMIALILLHFAAAMKHHFIAKDGLLSRMGIGRS